MTNDRSPATTGSNAATAPKPWIWLVIAAVLSVVSIAWLWSMTGPRVCILIYPAPPGCATLIPNWLPFVGVGIIAALFVAMVVLYLVRKPAPARLLVVLTIVIAAVALLTALIMLLAGLGTFDAYQPPVIVD